MTILERIVEDRRIGIKNKFTFYTQFFSDADTAKQSTLDNRIHKIVSRGRKLIEEAEEEYNARIVSRINTPVIESKRVNEKKEVEDITIEEYLDYCKAGTHITKSLQNLKYNKDINFNIGDILVFSSDNHIGASHSDLETMMEDFKFMIDNDIKIALNGDIIENKSQFLTINAVLSQTMDVNMQHDFLCKLLDKLKDNIVCYVQGNHDWGNKRNNMWESVKEACKKTNIDFFEGGCLLNINVGDNTWRCFLRHRPASTSKQSPLLGCKKLAAIEQADIYVTSHLHVPCCGTDYVLSRKRILIMTGCYAKDMPYSQQNYGIHSARSDFACVLFTKDDMLLFWNMRDAVIYRKGLLDYNNKVIL